MIILDLGALGRGLIIEEISTTIDKKENVIITILTLNLTLGQDLLNIKEIIKVGLKLQED